MSFRDLEASDKQYALMDKLGIEYDPQGVSVAEASKLIDAKLGKKPKDITSNYRQETSGEARHVSNTTPPAATNIDKDAQFRTPTQLTRIDCLKAAVEFANCLTDVNERAKLVSIKAEEFEKWVNR